MERTQEQKDRDQKLVEVLLQSIERFYHLAKELDAEKLKELLRQRWSGRYVINYAGDTDPDLHRNGMVIFLPD